MATKLATVYRSEVEALGKRASRFRPFGGMSSGPTPGKIIALDVFAGAGGFSTALLRVLKQQIATSGIHTELDLTILNHWSVALDNARDNLGNVTVINGSIQDRDPLECIPGGYVDVMLASPECFVAGTLVLTSRGLLPIEAIEPGMKVLTHKGRYRQVLATRKSVAKETIVLRGHGHYGLETTLNHPFYARKKSQVWNNTRRQYDRVLSQPGWENASQLSADYYWAVPTSFPKLPIPPIPGRGMNLDEKFFWLVGRYLGDGSLCNKASGDEITICCGKHEADELEVILAGYRPPIEQKRSEKGFLRFRRRQVRTATLFEAGHTGLVEWLEKHFGRRAENKKIPAWAFGMDTTLRKALLDGYLSADGNYSSQNTVSANSVSKYLAIGMRLIAESLGHHVSMNLVITNSTQIEGRSFTARPQYKFSYFEPLQREQCVEDVIHTWHPIRETKNGNTNVAVYNLQVEEDESYTADGIVVHNCIFFSQARGSKPINDQRRSTASEVLRFLEELDVQTLILENVKELQDWCRLDPMTHRPVKAYKGEYFNAFVKAIKNLGYDVAYDSLVAAAYGDPTTRTRLYLVAQKRGRARLPMPTHSKNGKTPGTLPYIPARKIIDFDLKGLSIFSRTVAHASKTLKRVSIGFADQRTKTPLANAYVTAVDRFQEVANIYHQKIAMLPSQKTLGRKLTKWERSHVRTVKLTAQHEHRMLVEQAFAAPVAELTWEDILLHESVQPTLDGEKRLTIGTLNALDPIITKLYGTGTTQSVDTPLDTVTSGGINFGLARPVPDTFLVTVNHGENITEQSTDNPCGRHASLDEPLRTVTTKNSQGVVKPFLLRANASDTSAWNDAITPVTDPLRTVTAKNNISLIVPDATLLPQHTYDKLSTMTPDVPLPAITTISRHGLVQASAEELTPEPFIDSVHGPIQGRHRAPRSLDLPLATQTTEPRFAFVDPVLVSQHYTWNENPSLDEPVVTATTRGTGYIAQPSITPDPILISRHIGFKTGVGPNPGLDEPIRTATTDGAGYIAQPTITPDPVLVSRHIGYNTGTKPNPSLDQPMHTATTRGAGYIAQPSLETADRKSLFDSVQPTIVNLKGQSTATSVQQPLPTQTAHAAHLYLAQPELTNVDAVIIPQQRGKGVEFDTLERPIRTMTAKNGSGIAIPNIAIPEPESFITPNFGERDTQKPRTHHLDAPLPAATSHGAGMLVGTDRPKIQPGKPYIIVSGTILVLDVTYRMLTKNELAKAMSFITDTDAYTFRADASTSACVRMIGNAVAIEVAKAIIAINISWRFALEAQAVAA